VKIELDMAVTLECDGCGHTAELLRITGLDELDRHERTLRATARVASDDIGGQPPSAWLAENLPAAWRLTVIRTPSARKTINTIVACSQICVDRALGLETEGSTP
jgi:hypothetical protein